MSLSWLKAAWPLLLALLYGAALWVIGSAQWDAGYAKAKAEGDKAIAELRLEHVEAELDLARLAVSSAKAAAKTLLNEQARNDQLAADLAAQQRTHRTTTDRLSGEIARVNDLYVKALDAEPEPLPACVFTAGWVRVYDEATGAIAAGMPSSTDTGRAAAQVAEGRAAEQLDSGISQRDVLEHHTRYAEQCRNTAAQLDLLIDAVEGN